jgi:hypothetical protein
VTYHTRIGFRRCGTSSPQLSSGPLGRTKEHITMKPLTAFIIFLFVTLLISCKSDKNNPVASTTQQLPDGIAGYVSVKYQYLLTTLFHTQTSMLTGYNNKLYRFGSQSPVQVWDLTNRSWSEIQLPDTTFARWDGVTVTIGDSIFVVAIYGNNVYDIITFDASKSIFHHTGVNLPTNFSHPAYCTYNDKIVFLTAQSDSVFEYNTTTRILRNVAANPFKGSVDYYDQMASGKYINLFYVFGGYSYLPNNKFCRLNLDTYTWEVLDMPSTLKQLNQFGASFGNQFVLFSDSVTTHQYSFVNNKWYVDTAKVPIFPRFLTGQLSPGEWSFFAEDTCLYATDIYANKLWKITE